MMGKFIAAAFSISLLATAADAADPGFSQASRILLIRNSSSSVSMAVARDYIQRRGVRNVLDISVPDAAETYENESIDYALFRSRIETPVRTWLATHSGIDFIVLTKGVPIRIVGAQELPCALDGYLAALGYDSIPGAIRVMISAPGYGYSYRGTAWANRFWNSKTRFSHAAFGGYLVSRLDGYTSADAIGLTTKALSAESAMVNGKAPMGDFLFDAQPYFGWGSQENRPYSVLKVSPPVHDTSIILDESGYGDYNADMRLASDSLRHRGFRVRFDSTAAFQEGITALMGYVSWGSNDLHFDPAGYLSLGFSPGALVETAVSTSARSFFPRSGGQSMIADLIQSGATGLKGYTDEPLLQAMASPSILFDRYTSGWTLVESYAAASNFVGWQDIIIGDPLCRAFSPDSDSQTGLRHGAEDQAMQTPITIQKISRYFRLDGKRTSRGKSNPVFRP